MNRKISTNDGPVEVELIEEISIHYGIMKSVDKEDYYIVDLDSPNPIRKLCTRKELELYLETIKNIKL